MGIDLVKKFDNKITFVLLRSEKKDEKSRNFPGIFGGENSVNFSFIVHEKFTEFSIDEDILSMENILRTFFVLFDEDRAKIFQSAEISWKVNLFSFF